MNLLVIFPIYQKLKLKSNNIMFSVRQKREIADAVQKILRETNHPELPTDEIEFHLHVKGAANAYSATKNDIITTKTEEYIDSAWREIAPDIRYEMCKDSFSIGFRLGLNSILENNGSVINPGVNGWNEKQDPNNCPHCTQGYVQDAGFVECNHRNKN